jgi:hypothetical protein
VDNRGGSRVGSGRKPGGKLMGSDPRGGGAVIEHQSALAELDPDVQSTIRWAARGIPKKEIAQRLSCNPATVARRLQAYPEAVSEAVRELVDPNDVLRPMLPQALTAIREILESPEDASTRLRAAQDLLDRLYGRPVVRQQTEMLADIHIQFISSPDAK